MAEKTAARRLVEDRKTAYSLVFGGETPHQRGVINDLKKFCRAEATTFHPDARIHALVEGRREVWLRIEQHLKLSSDELLVIAGGEE